MQIDTEEVAGSNPVVLAIFINGLRFPKPFHLTAVSPNFVLWVLDVGLGDLQEAAAALDKLPNAARYSRNREQRETNLSWTK